MTKANRSSQRKCTHLEMLEDEFCRRRGKNSGYSLRAFAKHAGVSVTTLSQVLSGKRSLSRSSAVTISENIFLDLSERKTFLLSSLGVQSGPHLDPPQGDCKRPRYIALDVDQFKLIAEWHHFAILSLAKVQPNFLDAAWVAGRLGIQKRLAKSALDRLLRLRLIVEDGGGFLEGSEPLFVQPTAPSSAVRQYHLENLERAKNALMTVPRDLRDVTSITMASSPEKIAGAKHLIQKFREDLCEYLEEGNVTDVFTLAIQLFPATECEVRS